MSFFSLGKSILGRKRETQRTEHDMRVTFWQVVIDILSQKMTAMRLFQLNSKATMHRCHLSSGDVPTQIRPD